MGKPLRRNGRYSTRRRIPKDLVAAYGGSKEPVIALDTADPGEARVRNARMWVTLDEQFAAKRVELQDSAGFAATEKSEADRRGVALMAAPFEVRQAAVISRLRHSRAKALDEGDLEEWSALRRFDLGWHQEVLNGREPPQMAMQNHEIGRNALRAVLDGEGAAAFAPEVNHLTLPDVLTLASLVQRWEAAKQPTAKTANKARAVIAEFEQAVGLGSLSTPQLTSRHINKFKDHLTASGAALATGNNKLGWCQLRTGAIQMERGAQLR